MLDTNIADVIHGHLEWWDDQDEEQQLFEGMYETRFWRSHVFQNGAWALHNVDDEDGGLPVKLEANRLWVWLNTFTSHLFLRQPRTVARLPGVLAPKAGRPRNLRELPERIEALTDEWLRRADVQELATYAYQLALMGGAAAFKLGVHPGNKGHVLDRVWMQVCPRWECVWDDRAATPQQQLFRGHLTYVLDATAERMVGASLPEKWERSRLPARYVDNQENPKGDPTEKVHPERYVRLLEFYDFEDEQQKFYLVSPDTRNPQLVPFGKPERIPYELPNGQCACPIYPVVLDNTPKHPMRGIPSARRIWRGVAEDNYIGSFIASSARRRMAMKGMYNKNLADDDVQRWWNSSNDLELLGVDQANLERLITFVQPPPIDPTIRDAQAWVDSSRRDTEGLSQQMQGQQGQYLTAKEAELVAEGGEATSLQIAARMVGALAKAAELMLVIVGTHEKKVQVVRGTQVAPLTSEQLKMPWSLRILDAGTTPSREASRKREWGLIEPMMEKLVTIASGGIDAAGAPVPVPEPLKRYARAALRYNRQVYDLPEDFSPEALLDGVEAEEDESQDLLEDAMEAGLPMPAPDAGLVPQGAQLPPEMMGGMAPPPGPAPLPLPPPTMPAPFVDPATGLAFDPATGAFIEPTTGQMIPVTPEGAIP